MPAIDSFDLEVKYDEKREAEIIGKICREWGKVCADLEKIYASMKKHYDKDIQKKKDKSYFG